jgi:hypothetical protein
VAKNIDAVRIWRCECCSAKLTLTGGKYSELWPEGWVQSGITKKFPEGNRRFAEWCPKCRSHMDTPVEGKCMESPSVTVGGTVYVPAKPEPKPELKPEPLMPAKKELAQQIVAVSAAMKSLIRSGLNMEAVITLVADRCPPIKNGYRSPHRMTKKEVGNVLRCLADLEKTFCAAS